MALVQTDLKRLAAYATLSAVSFIVLGIYAFTAASMDGAAYQILNESISASAFFMLLGILYERYGTYDMGQLGGIATKLPGLAVLFVITTLSLIGLPSLNVFVGEFLILSGSFQTHPGIASAATLGVILSAYLHAVDDSAGVLWPAVDRRRRAFGQGCQLARTSRGMADDCADDCHGCGLRFLDACD